MSRIAFDIDETLWVHDSKSRSVPNYHVIDLLKWFYENGDEIFVWSGGGLEYAEHVVEILGLTDMVAVVNKEDNEKVMDIAVDDKHVDLAKVNIKLKINE